MITEKGGLLMTTEKKKDSREKIRKGIDPPEKNCRGVQRVS